MNPPPCGSSAWSGLCDSDALLLPFFPVFPLVARRAGSERAREGIPCGEALELPPAAPKDSLLDAFGCGDTLKLKHPDALASKVNGTCRASSDAPAGREKLSLRDPGWNGGDSDAGALALAGFDGDTSKLGAVNRKPAFSGGGTAPPGAPWPKPAAGAPASSSSPFPAPPRAAALVAMRAAGLPTSTRSRLAGRSARTRPSESALTPHLPVPRLSGDTISPTTPLSSGARWSACILTLSPSASSPMRAGAGCAGPRAASTVRLAALSAQTRPSGSVLTLH